MAVKSGKKRVWLRNFVSSRYGFSVGHWPIWNLNSKFLVELVAECWTPLHRYQSTEIVEM